MIEINLSPSEKNLNLNNVGGFNLSLINVKMVLIALFILYVPEPFLEDHYNDELAGVENEIKKLRKEQRRITIELKEVQEIEKQVEALNKQEGDLKQKIRIVEKIVAKRQNPFKVLKYIAENTPKDVWVQEIKINDTSFEMIGYTTSWKSMGDFFENLKNSIFFSRDMEFNQNGEAINIQGQRVENFAIKTRIERFE